jgi:pimeloyl-ACP methyl ester carboxylesterase
MYPADQTSWFAYAGDLASRGFTVLTFDFRGYGESEGDKEPPLIDRDLAAAVAALRSRGAQQVAVVGASMGGTAALKAAARLSLAAVATLSAPLEFRGLSAASEVRRLAIPKLFLGAESDEGGPAAEELFAASPEPKDITVYAGDEHGTDLLRGAEGAAVAERLTRFLDEAMRADGG